jgi:hypothetical protein
VGERAYYFILDKDKNMSPVDKNVNYYQRRNQNGGDFPVFQGADYQRGHGLGGYVSQKGDGLGDFFRSLWRIAMSIV